MIEGLIQRGIHAKHLENTHEQIFQKRIDTDSLLYDESIETCRNYRKLNDHIVSIPISSNISLTEAGIVASEVESIIERYKA
jgi:fatty acid-binding protein DegV